MNKNEFAELLRRYAGAVKYAGNCSTWNYYEAVEIRYAYCQDVLTAFDTLQAENAAYREVLRKIKDFEYDAGDYAVTLVKDVLAKFAGEESK